MGCLFEFEDPGQLFRPGIGNLDHPQLRFTALLPAAGAETREGVKDGGFSCSPETDDTDSHSGLNVFTIRLSSRVPSIKRQDKGLAQAGGYGANC